MDQNLVPFSFECDCCKFAKWYGEASPQAVERYRKLWEEIHRYCGEDSSED